VALLCVLKLAAALEGCCGLLQFSPMFGEAA
jgi:hypothetical protein